MVAGHQGLTPGGLSACADASMRAMMGTSVTVGNDLERKGRMTAMAATVLLVEDERKLRDLVRSYLERAGFAVLSTESGAEALTLAATASPDLVVLDLGLPDVPGETVARELRAAGSTPILMLTAKTSEEDRIAGLELGADDYVTKPF